MNDNEKIAQWIKEYEDDYCNYCIYMDNCPKGMTCYGGAPIEPYCFACDNPVDFLDIDAILEDLKENN